MRFLIDRCAGRRLADSLRAQGHEVLEARTLGPDPGDEALLGLAAQEQRVLVTIDTDFGRIVYVGGQAHTGMVRLPSVPAEQRIRLMQEVLARHSNDLAAGAIITVRGGRIRISQK
jgi:predicted nuclease of predicted toxin-antitoxin system